MNKAWLIVAIALKSAQEELRLPQEQNKEKPRYDRHYLHDHNRIVAVGSLHVVRRFKIQQKVRSCFDDAVRGRI